jgi:broad specificity phosphatase PhoE
VRATTLSILWALLALVPPGHADGAAGDLVSRLQAGGYNIYFRHAATDWSQQDLVGGPGDWASCDPGVARQLSDAGRDTAVAVGEAMRALAVPVSELLASPYCRTMETAKLLGYGTPTPTRAVLNLRVAPSAGGRAGVIASARELLASVPPPGGNRVIVAHGNVAREATPVYPAEAEAVVFRPDGAGGFDLVARVTPESWLSLARRLANAKGVP